MGVMLKKFFALFILLGLVGCAGFKPEPSEVASIALDAAHAACVMHAKESRGFVEDAANAYCDNEDVLRPFVESLVRDARACR